MLTRRTAALTAGILTLSLAPLPISAQADTTSTASAPRDGPRDFDFGIGSWTTHLKLLRQPRTGSTDWVEYAGTSIVRTVLDGAASLVELDVEGTAGRIRGLSLRLYNPEARQWSLNYSNIRTGTLSPPVFGAFQNGRGAFHGQEFLNGRAILVRFIVTPVTPDSVRYEQAFSADGGETWELNWVAIDTRVK